jgi:hypothetical protein
VAGGVYSILAEYNYITSNNIIIQCFMSAREVAKDVPVGECARQQCEGERQDFTSVATVPSRILISFIAVLNVAVFRHNLLDFPGPVA